jgi:LuxR family maltose regulon positive regulatory protein
MRLLDAGRSRPLTLVSAPAGYGKSVLASSWLLESGWASAWISLDKNDSDLRRFLGYLSAAVRNRIPQSLETTASLSQTDELPEPRVVATIVSNELNAIDQPFILVLDDYHCIHASSQVNEVLRILLKYPPIPLHLVLLTRRDPPLPLGRLRALGQVTDVRMQDLRFSASETRELLEQVAQIHASEEAIANLDRELEGWVVGLRLLTLALSHAPDAEVLMKTFRGGTKQMREYLISEIVAGLPEHFHAWLLRTSLFDRFCAPLCDKVCGEASGEQIDATGGKKFIEHLKTSNFFLIPLDADGYWFRFHHLFKNFLQQELFRQLDVEAIAALHLRASYWYEENGFIEDAIRGAKKAGDSGAAADILERHCLDELEKLNHHLIDGWLEVLGPIPEDRPRLKLAEGFVAIRRFDIPRLAAILDEVAPVIEEDPDCANLIGELRCLQGVRSYRLGDGETSLKLLREARHQFNTSKRLGIAGTAAVHEALSLALCGRGDEALTQFEDLIKRAEADNPIYYNLLLTGLTWVCLLQGDLTQSAHDAERLESLAKTGGPGLVLGMSIYFRAFSDLNRGDFVAAAQRFGVYAQKPYAMPRHGAFQAMAGFTLSRQLLGNASAAAQAAGNLRNFAKEVNDNHGLEIARSCAARIQLLQGDLDRAARWAGFDTTLPVFGELFNSLEVSSITRARIWIALNTSESLERACNLLQKIGELARSLHFTNHIIEADVLKSLALAGLERRDEALKCLAETLVLAAQGNWIRPFIEPGTPLRDLFVQLDNYGFATDFSRQVHSQLQAWTAREESHAHDRSDLQLTKESGVYETLTSRELDVLMLLAQRLQNKEISDKLFVSTETIKSHLKNIYQKLNVGKRREAVEKAQKFGII